MALRKSRFLKAKASCQFIVAGRWKQMNLAKTPKDWQFRRKFKSNSAFRALIDLLEFAEIRNVETSFISGCYVVDNGTKRPIEQKANRDL